MTKPQRVVVDSVIPQSAEELARFAYLWAWPMMNVRARKLASSVANTPGTVCGVPVGPINHLTMLHDYFNPAVRAMRSPSQDLVYGTGFLSLDIEPVVLQVPDFGNRFWVYQVGDIRTDAFAQLGKQYDTPPGHYLLVGPNWKEKASNKFKKVFRSPSNTAYVIPRVFMEDTPEERQAILPLVNKIQGYPLSRFDGSFKETDWRRLGRYYRVWKFRSAGLGAMVPATFFDRLPSLLDEIPPLPGEAVLYDRLRALVSDASKSPGLRARLQQIAIETEKSAIDPMLEFKTLGKALSHHWRTVINGAEFGNDYETRTAVMKSLPFANHSRETRYFCQDFDAAQVRLQGDGQYELTFAKGELPPVNGFWSLTLYDAGHYFVRNELKRYSLGTKNKDLKFNADGSLTIWIQADAPRKTERLTNWLPAPGGQFSLCLRAYWPDERILKGSWTPPPVVRLS